MPAYKDKKTGLFYVQFYYRDARGAKRHKTKKGFQTELEALLWEKNFKALKDDAMDMTFADFCKVYEAEVRPVSVNIFFTIFTNVFSPIAPTRMRRIRQRGCAAFGV